MSRPFRSTRREFLAACAASLAWPALASAAPARRRRRVPASDAPKVALVGGRVILGDGRELAAGVVEFEGERLVRVAEGSTASAGFSAVDVTGKIVTPGLIVGLSRLGLVEIGMEDATRDDSRKDDDPVRAAFEVAPAVHAGSSLISVTAMDGFTSAITAPGGGLISGRSALVDLLPWDHRGLVAVPHVAMHGALGRTVKGSRAATLATLRRVLADARLYRANRRAYDRRQLRELAAHPADLDALGPVLDRKMPLVLRVQRASDILAAIDLARSERLRLVLAGCAQGWQVADELAGAKIPVIVQP
ncbi:MAG TPA: hypothetical protein ENJ85_03565, partial [Oceanithermus profundus]|nr:hypothetical protein [Oceanithermus profundus]